MSFITLGGPWEQVATGIIVLLADKELDASQAVPWLKALVDYAERMDSMEARGSSSPTTNDQEETMDG